MEWAILDDRRLLGIVARGESILLASERVRPPGSAVVQALLSALDPGLPTLRAATAARQS